MTVSIIIPVYRSQDYIEKCVRSVFNQTYKDLEIIIVDDCGNDNSIDIIKKVLVDFPDVAPNVKILRNRVNSGSAASRKNGMSVATGEYILQIDSDDYVELSMVEKMAKKAIEDDADMVVCNYYNITHKGVDIIKIDKTHDNIEFASKVLRGYIHAGVWNKMMRRSILEDHDIYPVPGLNMSDDMTILFRGLIFFNKISFIDDPLYHYNRIIPGSFSRSAYPMANDISIINLFDSFLKRNKIDNPQLLESFQMFKIVRLGRTLLDCDLDEVKRNREVFSFENRLIMKHKHLPIHYRLIVWAYSHHLLPVVFLLRQIRKQMR